MIKLVFEQPSHKQTGQIVKWLNDKDLMKYSEQRHKKHTLASQWLYYASMEDDGHITGLILNESNLVGTVSALIDDYNHVADIGILIGSEYIGKGYGRTAWAAFCGWLGDGAARKIEAGCMARNKAMIRIFEVTGMRLEGTRRYHFQTGKNQYDDMVMYGMLT